MKTLDFTQTAPASFGAAHGYLPLFRATQRVESEVGAGSGVGGVSVLFARRDSTYKMLAGCDVWDIDRDALNYQGGSPVIAHPPCRSWGELAHMANPRPGEKELAPWAVEQVRKWGGVLEHPLRSKLWPAMKLPEPGERDEWGGWTLEIRQYDFGHRAEKWTRLYIVGVPPAEIPPLPKRTGTPSRVVSTGHGLRVGDPGFRVRCTDREREHTPIELARWLVSLAGRAAGAGVGLKTSPAEKEDNDQALRPVAETYQQHEN